MIGPYVGWGGAHAYLPQIVGVIARTRSADSACNVRIVVMAVCILFTYDIQFNFYLNSLNGIL